MTLIRNGYLRHGYLSLTPAVLHILLSLAEDNRHGLGIPADVKAFTNGRLTLGPGTLPADPAAQVSLAVLVTAISLLAMWVPTRRAERVDPVTALRNE